MRIIAGLQESKTVENPMMGFIEQERTRTREQQARLKNEKKNVIGNFTLFEEKISRLKEMIGVVEQLFADANAKEFINGLYESRYSKLQQFADVVINDDMPVALEFLEQHYYSIKTEIDKISALNERLHESSCPIYFVANALISNDQQHNITIPVFKYQTLEEKIADEIPYGAELVQVSDSITLIKHSGKRFYTRLTEQQLHLLEKKGFII